MIQALVSLEELQAMEGWATITIPAEAEVQKLHRTIGGGEA